MPYISIFSSFFCANAMKNEIKCYSREAHIYADSSMTQRNASMKYFVCVKFKLKILLVLSKFLYIDIFNKYRKY